MSVDQDVIVVGAGPAGSTAARECAQKGLRVVILDKAEFPRDKPCGGGVNVRAARRLPFSIDSVVEGTAFGWAIRSPGGREARWSSAQPLTFLTQRRELDALLLEKALSRGATLRERTVVREVRREKERVLVVAGAGTLSAGCLIIADGANGTTARIAGIRQRFQHGVALEAKFGIQSDYAPRDALLRLELGTVGGGYGWAFQKRDHLNVGVGGWLSEAPRLRAALNGFADRHRLGKCLSAPRAHRLPVRVPGATLVSGRVLLAGDAAGLIDPLTGDGIYGAIESGRLAAEHVADLLTGRRVDLRSYATAIEDGLGAESALGVVLHDVLHAWPEAACWALSQTQALWEIGSRILRGDSTGREERARFELAWPGLLLAARVGRIKRARRAEQRLAAHAFQVSSRLSVSDGGGRSLIR